MNEIKKRGAAFRNDAVAKVTGRAKYTDDLKFHNMLHAIPVYTDYVHARINKIDITKAKEQPGVVKIITAKDILGERVEVTPVFSGEVDGISYSEGVAYLNVGGVLIPFDKVKQITQE